LRNNYDWETVSNDLTNSAARSTNAMPPRPIDCASTAAHSLRLRSLSADARAEYFCRTADRFTKEIIHFRD